MVIPRTLNECFLELKKIEELEEWLKEDEETASSISHHTVGRWIRNNWGLWKGEGDLYNWFKLNEINHPDDMSGIILRSFHRYMNNKDIKLDELIENVVDYYLTEKEKIIRRRNKKLNNLNKNVQ